MSDQQCMIDKKIFNLIEMAEEDDRPVMTFRLASTALFFMDTMIREGYHDAFLEDFMENVGKLYIKKNEKKKNHLKIVH